MTTALAGYALAAFAIIGATVAVCLGHIDQQTYATIVGFGAGGGLGVGAHAAGQASGQAQAAPPPTPPTLAP